jgi:hypothetical protein
MIDFSIKGTKIPVIPKGTNYLVVGVRDTEFNVLDVSINQNKNMISHGIKTFMGVECVLCERNGFTFETFWAFPFATLQILAKEQNLITQEQSNPTKPMIEDRKEFTVSGNKHLLKAFEADLLESGYNESFWNKRTLGDPDFCAKHILINNSHVGQILGNNTDPLVKHYELPQRYEEAKACALSYLKPKEVSYKLIGDNEILVKIRKNDIGIIYNGEEVIVTLLQLTTLINQIAKVNDHKITSWKFEVEHIKIGCKQIRVSDIININARHTQEFGK